MFTKKRILEQHRWPDRSSPHIQDLKRQSEASVWLHEKTNVRMGLLRYLSLRLCSFDWRNGWRWTCKTQTDLEDTLDEEFLIVWRTSYCLHNFDNRNNSKLSGLPLVKWPGLFTSSCRKNRRMVISWDLLQPRSHNWFLLLDKRNIVDVHLLPFSFRLAAVFVGYLYGFSLRSSIISLRSYLLSIKDSNAQIVKISRDAHRTVEATF